MEIQATETSENSTLVPVVSTQTTETLDPSTPPVVAHPQTTETAEQSPPLVTNTQTAETSEQSTLSEVTNTQTAETLEHSALPQATNTQTTENLEQSILPDVTNTQATENLEQSILPDATNTQTTESLEQSIIPDATSTQATKPPPASNTQTTETLEQSTLPPLTDTKTTEPAEQSILPSYVADNSHVNLVSSPENHQGMEMRQETVEEEEVRSVLKVIAATGKFWHDWVELRSMLSLHLKQVISEYHQAKMTTEKQKFSLGETHAELVKRLDDALHSFTDGPPFTLQRLAEILLDARSLYPNLSKLALALEKNLSVTSTLTLSTDPYPPAMITTPNGLDKVTVDPNPNSQLESDTVMENGSQHVAADRDEIMTEVEADVSDVMTMDMETYEKSSESSPMTTGPS